MRSAKLASIETGNYSVNPIHEQFVIAVNSVESLVQFFKVAVEEDWQTADLKLTELKKIEQLSQTTRKK